MKKNLTELVFILDRSGSMSGLESDTIGGYNALLAEQREVAGECTVTTVLFDDKYELLHDRINVRGIKPITSREYFVRGTTALLDAVGLTINKIKNALANTSEEARADKVLFVITTDGMENASREYKYGQIKQMIEEQKEKQGWEFIFLGANIDAVEFAGRFGIDSSRASNYHADGDGIAINYSTLSQTVSKYRSRGGVIDENWKKEIDDDFKSRKK